MGVIRLEAMRFHAYHGFYEEEQMMGNEYELDVELTTMTGMAAITDDLHQTINYETVYELCKIVMREKTKLLETVNQHVIAAIRHQFPMLQGISVKTKKIHPPLGADVAASVVETNSQGTSVGLEGMRFHAFHGFHEADKLMGNDYLVDVFVKANTTMAAASDDLYQTINYETIYDITKMVMNQRTNLLETIGERILTALKQQFANLQGIEVRIAQINPPVGGLLAYVSVETSAQFASKCGRCGSGILCYGDQHCRCKDINIYPRTQEAILRQYKSCLCKNCMNFYAN